MFSFLSHWLAGHCSGNKPLEGWLCAGCCQDGVVLQPIAPYLSVTQPGADSAAFLTWTQFLSVPPGLCSDSLRPDHSVANWHHLGSGFILSFWGVVAAVWAPLRPLLGLPIPCWPHLGFFFV